LGGAHAAPSTEIGSPSLADRPFSPPSGATQEAARRYLLQFEKVPLSICFDRAQGGDSDAQYCAARALMEGDWTRYEQLVITYLRASADAGNFFAQNDFGHHLLKGLSTPKDLKEAFHWFMKAAEAGVANAQVSVGWHYMCGLGVEIDYEQARKWNSRGAEKGLAEGANNLAWLYEYGLGGPQDLEAARGWYLQAADRGSKEASERLENLDLPLTIRRIFHNDCKD
jgi:TPR repeat protein